MFCDITIVYSYVSKIYILAFIGLNLKNKRPFSIPVVIVFVFFFCSLQAKANVQINPVLVHSPCLTEVARPCAGWLRHEDAGGRVHAGETHGQDLSSDGQEYGRQALTRGIHRGKFLTPKYEYLQKAAYDHEKSQKVAYYVYGTTY
jgi:hypothetical protein